MKENKFADRLNIAMEKRGLRAVDVVEKTGIPKGTLSYYLSGKSKPKSDRIYILAQLLNVNEAWLLGYDTPMERTEDQKKNDQLTKLIVKMRTDIDFYNTVAALADLSEKQFKSVQQLIAAFDE